MPIAVECSCGKTMSVPDEFAGRKGRCRQCGRTLLIPSPFSSKAEADPREPSTEFLASTIQLGDDDFEDRPSKPAPLRHDELASVPRQDVPDMTREPWYYRFLSVYAYLIIGCAGLAAALGLIATVVMIALTPKAWLFSLVTLAYSFGMAFVGALLGAPILLTVDVARNLRVLRLQGQSAGSR